jgi:hypothetical protein
LDAGTTESEGEKEASAGEEQDNSIYANELPSEKETESLSFYTGEVSSEIGKKVIGGILSAAQEHLERSKTEGSTNVEMAVVDDYYIEEKLGLTDIKEIKWWRRKSKYSDKPYQTFDIRELERFIYVFLDEHERKTVEDKFQLSEITRIESTVMEVGYQILKCYIACYPNEVEFLTEERSSTGPSPEQEVFATGKVRLLEDFVPILEGKNVGMLIPLWHGRR